MGAQWVNLVKGTPGKIDTSSRSSKLTFPKDEWFWVDRADDVDARQSAQTARGCKSHILASMVAKEPAPKHEDDWMRVSNEEVSSEEDLSDLEDNDLVSLAPRNRISVHEPPTVASMTHEEAVLEESNIMRKRPSSRPAAPCEPPAATSSIQPGPVSCWDVKFDSNVDLVWTFVAGMCLYLLSF